MNMRLWAGLHFAATLLCSAAGLPTVAQSTNFAAPTAPIGVANSATTT
jgi:hypothetical protein